MDPISIYLLPPKILFLYLNYYCGISISSCETHGREKKKKSTICEDKIWYPLIPQIIICSYVTDGGLIINDQKPSILVTVQMLLSIRTLVMLLQFPIYKVMQICGKIILSIVFMTDVNVSNLYFIICDSPLVTTSCKQPFLENLFIAFSWKCFNFRSYIKHHSLYSHT